VIRVMLVDDQAMIRQGLRMILEAEPDVTVVGEAADGRDALDVAERAHPDVVLMDIRMPTMDGIEACRRLRERGDPARVVDADHLRRRRPRVRRARIRRERIPPQGRPAEDLIAAVRVVHAGDALLAPSVTRRLIAEFGRRPRPDRNRHRWIDDLTERETEVLASIAHGRSNAEIAGHLHLGEATVKTHVGRILAKLGARDRVQAVILAYESGLVASADPTRPDTSRRARRGRRMRHVPPGDPPRVGSGSAEMGMRSGAAIARHCDHDVDRHRSPRARDGADHRRRAVDAEKVYGLGESQVRALDGVTVSSRPAGSPPSWARRVRARAPCCTASPASTRSRRARCSSATPTWRR
jgi:DNA-binding NarL/FixJ family response regulator